MPQGKIGWTTRRHDEWTKHGHNGQADFKLNMKEAGFHLKQELKRAEQSERIQINKRSMFQGDQAVQQPLDWQPWQKLAITLYEKNATVQCKLGDPGRMKSD